MSWIPKIYINTSELIVWCRYLAAEMRLNSAVNRKLKQLGRRRRRRQLQQQRQKNNWFYEQNNFSARASRFLAHFFDVYCTTTTWNSQSDVLWRTWTNDDKSSLLYLNMDKALKNSALGKIAYIWRIERYQIDAIKVWKDANSFS